jgi:hypothetical protein
MKAFFAENKVRCELCSYSVLFVFCTAYLVVVCRYQLEFKLATNPTVVSDPEVRTEKSPIGTQEPGSSKRTF